MPGNRIISAEHIEAARRRGRVTLEVLPGDIVTALANDTAARLGIRLLDGPIERAVPVRTDGGTAMYRGLYRRSSRWVTPRDQTVKHPKRFSKIAFVGAGGVGAGIAHLAACADIAHEITLTDVAPGIATATALDLNHASGITGSRTLCSGSEDIQSINGAEVVVVTAGRARAPGMTRSDLSQTNTRIIRTLGQHIATQAPNSVVIVVTNPLDEMTVEMLRATGFPRERVLGMAGTLDSCRLRASLAQAAGVDAADVQAVTLGSHGDEMIPIVSQARIKGRSLERFLTQEQITACIEDTTTGGAQVVALKKHGSATLAPAHATLEVLEHIRGARSGWVPVSVMLSGEYGLHGVVVGVPAYLGATGLISVEELRLKASEKLALQNAAEAVRQRLADQ